MYELIQEDSDESVMYISRFESIPTLEEFEQISFYVDRDNTKSVYFELIENIGRWVRSSAINEDGDLCEYNLEDGVYFILNSRELT